MGCTCEGINPTKTCECVSERNTVTMDECFWINVPQWCVWHNFFFFNATLVVRILMWQSHYSTFFLSWYAWRQSYVCNTGSSYPDVTESLNPSSAYCGLYDGKITYAILVVLTVRWQSHYSKFCLSWSVCRQNYVCNTGSSYRHWSDVDNKYIIIKL